jgi:hypothetical protein
VELAGALERQAAPTLGMVSVTGQNRTASEVAAELLSVLADEPRVVVCDLTGMAVEGSAVPGSHAPVASHVRSWPGTVLMVNGADRAVRDFLGPATGVPWLLVNASSDAEAAEAHRLLPPVRRTGLRIDPTAGAPREARDFTTQTLREWNLRQLIGPASHVVSAFVTASVTEAPTSLDLTVSRVDARVRIAVREDGTGHAAAPPGAAAREPLKGRGRELVHAYADHWGVISAPSGARSVWAVLDAASPPRRPELGGEERPSSRHRGKPDADVFLELHGGHHRGRHRREADATWDHRAN